MLNLFTAPLMPLIETNPPPARIGMKMGFIVMDLLFIDVDSALAGWMHRVCADLAGWDETSI